MNDAYLLLAFIGLVILAFVVLYSLMKGTSSPEPIVRTRRKLLRLILEDFRGNAREPLTELDLMYLMDILRLDLLLMQGLITQLDYVDQRAKTFCTYMDSAIKERAKRNVDKKDNKAIV